MIVVYGSNNFDLLYARTNILLLGRMMLDDMGLQGCSFAELSDGTQWTPDLVVLLRQSLTRLQMI